MKNAMLVTALVLSILSLGLQVRSSKAVPFFDKYLRPAQISEFDYRVIQFNEQTMHEATEMRNGIGPPFIKKLSDDHKRLIVRILVSEEDLPTGFDARKKALEYAAIAAYCTAANSFDLECTTDAARSVISVEFIGIRASAKAGKGQETKPYAEYVNGELVFH